MSQFSWQCQNRCLLSLAFIIDWRVVEWKYKHEVTVWNCIFQSKLRGPTRGMMINPGGRERYLKSSRTHRPMEFTQPMAASLSLSFKIMSRVTKVGKNILLPALCSQKSFKWALPREYFHNSLDVVKVGQAFFGISFFFKLHLGIGPKWSKGQHFTTLQEVRRRPPPTDGVTYLQLFERFKSKSWNLILSKYYLLDIVR